MTRDAAEAARAGFVKAMVDLHGFGNVEWRADDEPVGVTQGTGDCDLHNEWLAFREGAAWQAASARGGADASKPDAGVVEALANIETARKRQLDKVCKNPVPMEAVYFHDEVIAAIREARRALRAQGGDDAK